MTKPAKKPKPSTQVSIKRLFAERMRREGKDREWKACIKKIQTEQNLQYSQAYVKAMPLMGYEGPERERQHEREWIQGMDVERAMCYLPPMSTPEVENNWVLAHPALNRKQMSDDGKVKIAAWDLFFAPHGRCPSMRAANKLIAWANDSKEMRANLAAGVKKSETNDGSKTAKEAETLEDDGLEELKRLLGEVV
jgi:hypothetical protein